MESIYRYSFISRNVKSGTGDVDDHLNAVAAEGWSLVSATTNVLWQKGSAPDAVVFHAFYWERSFRH